MSVDHDTRTLIVHAEGCSPATPSAQLAATLASIIATTLTEQAAPTGACLNDQPQPGAVPHPADDVPAATDLPTTHRADEVPVDEVPVDEVPADDVGDQALPERVVTDAQAGARIDHDADHDERPGRDERGGELRRAALQLLDDGLDDDQICARLGISRARLLRWDDPYGQFASQSADGLTGNLAAVTA